MPMTPHHLSYFRKLNTVIFEHGGDGETGLDGPVLGGDEVHFLWREGPPVGTDAEVEEEVAGGGEVGYEEGVGGEG